MEWFEIFEESLEIVGLIFILMVFVEFFELKFSSWLRKLFIENNSIKYILSSFFGILPGCTGTFLIDTLYMAGITGFGGVVAVMISSIGDEAFIILSMAANPDSSITFSFLALLLGTMFFLGIFGGWFADVLAKLLKIKVTEKCNITKHEEVDHPKKLDWGHFFKVHVWSHIVKKHLVRIAFWVILSLILVTIIEEAYVMRQSIADNMPLLLLIAGIIGLVPLSGPNVVIITFFAEGVVPFSILLTNSIIQEGHGLLPLLGFSLEDSLKIKLFKVIFGYSIGFTLLAMGY